MSTINHQPARPVTDDWDWQLSAAWSPAQNCYTCTPTPSPNDSTASKGVLDIDWVTHPDQAFYVQLALRLHSIF